jgi:hypothetical protein
MDPAIVKRTKRLKAKTFPFALFSMVFAVATAALGGGADEGSVSSGVHVGLAFSTLALNVLAFSFERSSILENHDLIERVSAANVARVRQGIPEAMRPAAAMQAAVAGRRVFLFLAANVWLLYAYRRFVMRHADEPWIPYAVACVLFAVVGVRMKDAATPASE